MNKQSIIESKKSVKRSLFNWLPFVYNGKTELGKRIACALLGVALSIGGAGLAWAENITYDPAADITVGTGDTLTVENFNVDGNDPTKTVTMNGGKLSYGGSDTVYFNTGEGKFEYNGTEYSKIKGFVWGSNGTINVSESNGSLLIRQTHINKDTLTIEGKGLTLITRSGSSDVHSFGSIIVDREASLIINGNSVIGTDKDNADGLVQTSPKSHVDFYEQVMLYGSLVNDNSRVTLHSSGFVQRLENVSTNSQFSTTCLNGKNDVSVGLGSVRNNGIITERLIEDVISSQVQANENNCTYEECYTNADYQTDNKKKVVAIGNYESVKTSFSNGSTLSGITEFTSPVVVTGTYLSEAYLNESGNVVYSRSFIDKDGVDNTVNYEYSDHFLNGVTVRGNEEMPAMLVMSSAFIVGDVKVFGKDTIAKLYGKTKVFCTSTINSDIIVGEGAEIQGAVTNLKQDIYFKDSAGNEDSSGTVTFGNYSNTYAFEANKPYITLDENKQPTTVYYDNTYANLYGKNGLLVGSDEFVNDNVINTNIIGSGTIKITSDSASINNTDLSYNGTIVPVVGSVTANFTGNTNVETGTLMLMQLGSKNQTQYGSSTKTGIVDIAGFNVSESSQKNKYIVESNGQLLFERYSNPDDNTNTEMGAVLYADIVNFGTGNAGGARLWLDTTIQNNTSLGDSLVIDFKSDRLLGTINANTINFHSNTSVWYNGVSALDGNTQLKFNLLSNNITVDGTAVTSGNNSMLLSIYNKPLVTAMLNDIPDGTEVVATVKSVTDYASSLDSTAQKGAISIENNRLMLREFKEDNEGTKYTTINKFYEALYNESDASVVNQTLHNVGLSNGLTNVVTQPQLGSAGSQFFGGATAGSMSSVSTRGQSKDANQNALHGGCGLGSLLDGWTVWGGPSYTSIKADGYMDQGLQKDGYRVNRAGFLGGLRRQFDDKTSGGFIFAYSGPEMSQSGAYESWGTSYRTDIDMSDYQVAMHLEHVFCDKWEANFFVGTGAQYLDWDRSLYVMGDGAYNYNGGTKGNTFTFTAYLARPIEINKNFVIRPTIGLDSEHSWLYGFEESGTEGGATGYSSIVTQRMGYDKISYSRNMARLGLVASSVSDSGRGGMSGRIFYGVALGGDDAASVHMVGLDNGFDFGNVEGYAMGNESLNLGYGLYYYLNEAKTLSVSADYNAILYKNATTQNVTAGIQYKF